MIAWISRPAAIAGILAGLLLFCAPSIVRADLEVTFSIDGGAPILVADNPVDFSSAGFNGAFGAFKVVFFGATLIFEIKNGD